MIIFDIDMQMIRFFLKLSVTWTFLIILLMTSIAEFQNLFRSRSNRKLQTPSVRRHCRRIFRFSRQATPISGRCGKHSRVIRSAKIATVNPNTRALFDIRPDRLKVDENFTRASIAIQNSGNALGRPHSPLALSRPFSLHALYRGASRVVRIYTLSHVRINTISH